MRIRFNLLFFAGALVCTNACANPEPAQDGYSDIDISSRCIPIEGTDEDHCSVLGSGSLGSGDQYRYALYIVRDPVLQDSVTVDDPDPNGVAIFQRAGERWRVSYTESPLEYSSSFYHQPYLREQSDTILMIPVQLYGTGSYREDRFFLRRDTSWIAIDSHSFVEEMMRQLPAGVEIWKGIAIDPATLSFETSLWRPGDANCCPSGGTASASLVLRDTRFHLRNVRHSGTVPDSIP